MVVCPSSLEWRRSSSALRLVVARLIAIGVRTIIGVRDSIGDNTGYPIEW
jgi:hypothetical protein